MDRRSFLRTASAAGLLPLLPAMPTASAAATAAAPVANEFMYGMAVFNARLRGVSSPEKISRDLGIAKEAAARLQTRMVKDGFVGLPGASGVARSSQPISRSLYQRSKTTEKLKEIARARFEEVKEQLLDEDVPEGCSAKAEASQQEPT